MTDEKSKLGQFYTKKYEYIFSGFSVPNEINKIIEPFAGEADLLSFLEKDKYSIESFDIDPKKDFITKRDTILNPPDYKGKFVLTNPPYLARNKSKDKTIYNKYDSNDLYKCFLETLLLSNLLGGILIVPLNFICSIRAKDINLRKRFLEKYSIKKINIFEEQVFDDTSYTVCSFLFSRKEEDNEIEATIFPSKKNFSFSLCEKNNFTIGGEIYKLSQNGKYKIDRATKKNKENITNILVKCIDDSIENQISLSMVGDEQRYIDNTEKLSARSYATLTISPVIGKENQKELVDKFNKFLKENRKKYHSLFLTNYRESNSIARKRISFSLVYRICNHLLSN